MAAIPSITSQTTYPPMKDLYPQEIISALGGIEALERLEENTLKPEYSANVRNCRYTYEGGRSTQIIPLPEGPSISRGVDQFSRPFLEVCLPGHEPLAYYTYSNCQSAADFRNIKNWNVSVISSSRVLVPSDCALLLLKTIREGGDYKELRQKVMHWSPAPAAST